MMKRHFKLKTASLALMLALTMSQASIAAISAEQLPFSADPYQKWQGWQDAGAATVNTPQLRDGNVYNLNPAQIIYYAALENQLNPLLLLVKLQTEQSLIERPYQMPELTRRLERAVGYGYIDSDPSKSKWAGFYPQLVGMSYEFSTMRLKKNFHDAFIEYTPYESKYTELVGLYAKYAAKMNTLANKKYATNPSSTGYLNDFRDISVNHIQLFLNAFNGSLKNQSLFPHDSQTLPAIKAKIVAMPAIPLQIKQNDTLKFSVTTDKTATKVTIVFTNPDAERTLDGSGKSWSFNSAITVANNRTWLLRVYSGTQITDERFGGNINIIGNSPASSLAPWQSENLDYALKQNSLYASTPLTNVYGQSCGTYTLCTRWSRFAPNSYTPAGNGSGLGSAKETFASLLTRKTAIRDTDFSHAPIGSIVFYESGTYGHAAIKVDETHIISQGQLGSHDCTISNVAWTNISKYAGYYAPAAGTTVMDNNIIPKADQVTRGQFLTALAIVLEKAAPELPDDAIEKATAMGLLTDPQHFDANSPIIRQDAARLLARAIHYFEINKHWLFVKTGNSQQFAKDALVKADSSLYAVAVTMAELGLFTGVLQEDASYNFEGLRQLSKTEKTILLDKRLPALLTTASNTPQTGYSKIANDGSLLADSAVLGSSAKNWACMRDNATGLIWEIKTDDGGLRDKDNTYSWYDSNPLTNGGFAGYQSNGDGGYGSCTGGILCNTEAYKNAVNTKTLCGYSDWRVPSVEHLKTLINTNYYPTINPSYFPNTVTYYYWSASPVANSSSSAWIVFFYYGYDDWDGKSDGDFVRLVRAGQ